MGPLEYRRFLLRKLLKRIKSDMLRFNEAFDDPWRCSGPARRHGLETIISKIKENGMEP